MGGFAEAARERVQQARARLRAALDEQDEYEVDLAQDELEDALRLARKHGISTDGPAGTAADGAGSATGVSEEGAADR